ncbi:unnamed protein product [Linum trigynum]|uniref:Uncharacterized protein n=1 Tax=Linum trigynum TaxID=586398 RepID=A0AAV2EQP8_9ROSI
MPCFSLSSVPFFDLSRSALERRRRNGGCWLLVVWSGSRGGDGGAAGAPAADRGGRWRNGVPGAGRGGRWRCSRRAAAQSALPVAMQRREGKGVGEAGVFD